METVYRVDLGRILGDLGEQLVVTDDADIGVISLGTEHFTPVGPVHVEMTLTNTGAGVVGHGSVAAEFDTVCARCLKPFVLTVEGDIDAFYIMPEHTHELPEEQEYELIRERGIDIMPALVAALTVELPFAPLHEPDCAGICPKCGVDLNEETCNCADDASDSPFSALRDIMSGERDE